MHARKECVDFAWGLCFIFFFQCLVFSLCRLCTSGASLSTYIWIISKKNNHHLDHRCHRSLYPIHLDQVILALLSTQPYQQSYYVLPPSSTFLITSLSPSYYLLLVILQFFTLDLYPVFYEFTKTIRHLSFFAASCYITQPSASLLLNLPILSSLSNNQFHISIAGPVVVLQKFPLINVSVSYYITHYKLSIALCLYITTPWINVSLSYYITLYKLFIALWLYLVMSKSDLKPVVNPKIWFSKAPPRPISFFGQLGLGKSWLEITWGKEGEQ